MPYYSDVLLLISSVSCLSMRRNATKTIAANPNKTRIARMIAKTTPMNFNTTILPGSLLQPIFLDPCPSDRSGDPLGLEVMCPLVVGFEVGDGSPHVLHLEFPAIHL